MKAGAKKAAQIKICGLTKSEEAAYLNEIHAAYAGFVFWGKSRRNVSLDKAQEIRKSLDKGILSVAVTVSPDSRLLDNIMRAGFDILQVHGTLNTQIVRQCGIPIWRACNLKSPQDMECMEQHEKITGYVLDAGTAGSGRTFDWAGCLGTIEKMQTTVLAGKTLILAGGLNPQNIAQAVELFRPDVVDVSSGVEGAQGKERKLVAAFAQAVREAG